MSFIAYEKNIQINRLSSRNTGFGVVFRYSRSTEKKTSIWTTKPPIRPLSDVLFHMAGSKLHLNGSKKQYGGLEIENYHNLEFYFTFFFASKK